MRRKQPPPTRKSPGFRALGRLFGRSRPRRFASRRDRGLPRLAGGESLEPKRLLVWNPTLVGGVLQIAGTSAASDILTLEMLDGTGSTIRAYNVNVPGSSALFTGVTSVVIFDTDPTPASDNDQLIIINSAGSPITTSGTSILFGGALPISTTNVEDFTLESPVVRANISLDGPGPAGVLTVRNADLVTVGATSPLRVGGLSVEAVSLALNGPLTAAGSAIASGSVSLDIVSPMTIAAPIVGSTTTGTITIRGNGGILQTAAGSLTAANLSIENVVAGNVDLDDATNAIGTLQITNRSAGGLLSFRDGDSLTLAAALANDGAIRIESGGTLSITGLVDAGEGTVSLHTRNGMTQSAAGSVIGTTLTLSNGLVGGSSPASGSISLDTAVGNRVEVVAAVNVAAQGDVRLKNSTGLAVGSGIGAAGISAVGGVVAVTSAGSLTLDQPITAAGGGSVALTAVSGITQAGSAVVTALALAAVNTGADGAVALDAAENAVTFIGGSNTAGDGGFAFRGAGGLTVSTAKIDVGGAGRIALFSKGSIDQVGILAARELLVVNENTEGGSITLDLGNTVERLAVQNQFDAGSVSFTNAAALAIAGIGLDAAGNDLRLRVAGGISQAFETSEGGAIVARSLMVVRTADGLVDIQNPENDVDSLGANLDGDGAFLYRDADGFNVGVLPTDLNGIIGDGVVVTLGAGGSITQSGRILAESVYAYNQETGEGNILLDLPANVFTAFASANAFEDGRVSVAVAGGLTIGVDGIEAVGNIVSISINGVLGATGDLDQDGRVSAKSLLVRNPSPVAGGDLVLDLQDNAVESFAAANDSSTGTIVFSNSAPLGIDAAGVRGRSAITLESVGDMAQVGTISTPGLLSVANRHGSTGDVVLGAGNDVGTLVGRNANPLGVFSFNDATDLVIGDGGIAAAGNVVALSVGGSLSQTATATSGVVGDSLTITNVNIAQGVLLLDKAGVNDVGTLTVFNAFTGGVVAYADSSSVTIGDDGISAVGNAVSLTVAGDLVHSKTAEAGVVARSLTVVNTLASSGSILLDRSDLNDVDLLAVTNAGVSATTAFADIDGLTIAAGGINAAAGAGNVRLVAGGTLDQLGVVTARHLAVSSAAGSVLLSLANDVDILDAETLDAAGVLSFTAAGPLEIGDVGILAAGVANLTVGGDLVQAADTSGAVTATTLNLVATKVGSGFGLVGTANDVDVLTASIAAGSLDFVDVDDLSIGRLTGSTVGFKAAGSAVSLTVGGDGNLTQTGSITADSLAVASEDGDISLGLEANSVKVLTGSGLTGSLLYRNSTALAIGDAGIATEGNVSLTTVGAITQTGAVAADALSVTNLLATAGAITLDLADNDVASFAAVNKAAAAIIYRDASDFTIGAAGVSTRSDITLTSAGDMLQGVGSGSIAGTQLTLLNLNEQFGDVSLANPLNSIVSITATNEAYDGDIAFNDTNGLSVVGTGVRSNLGDISLATTGALSLAADVFADQDDFAPSRVTLSATRGILQPAGAVTANQLSLSNASSSPVTLAQAANNVDNLAATSIGNITYVDADSFETGILSSKVKSVEVSTKGVLRLTSLGDVLRVVGGLDYAKSGQTGQLFLSVGADDQIGMVELVPTSQGDNPTAGSAFAGTLRDMITYANQNRVRRPSGTTTIVQPQTVVFDASTVNTISVTQPLQAIAQPLAFDGSRVTSNVVTPRVGLNGAGITAAAANGLTFLSTAAGSSVAGMAIHGFTKGAGIQIQAANTTVTNTYFGLNRDSKVSANLYGIDLPSTLATGATIGGAGLDAGVPDPTLANVFAANTAAGVIVRGGASANSIVGNYIGTDADGRSLGNREGVLITGATGTRVGDNVVSFNKVSGVTIAGARATATAPNVVERNVVTSNGAGSSTAATAGAGILVTASAFARIGREGAGNVVGLNGHGIVVQQGSTNTTISGNAVGTSALFAGEPIANRFDGIRVVASAGNLVGGLTEESRNEIAFNGRHGLDIENALAATTAAGNQILSNRIFANTSHGVRVSGGGRNVIGTGAATANTITSNGGDGIRIEAFGKFGSIGNLIQGNLIGTDSPLDDTDLGNVGNGLTIIGGSANVVDRVNVIRFNNGYGVRVQASSSNVIGSNLPDQGNIISDNGNDGISITSGPSNLPTTNNVVSGNEISENGGSGISVSGSNTKNTVIGTNTVGGVSTGQPNVIVDNGGYGVNVTNGASQVQIQGNEIDGNASGGINTAPGTQQGVRPPTLSSAVIYLPPTGAPQLLVEGSATGTPRQRLMISIYATPAGASGGPAVSGLIYLGSVTVVIGTNGTVSFRATLNLGEAIEGDLVTATTTTLSSLPGSTSQFSSPAVAIRSPTVPDVAAPPNNSGGSSPNTGGGGSGGSNGTTPPPRTL